MQERKHARAEAGQSAAPLGRKASSGTAAASSVREKAHERYERKISDGTAAGGPSVYEWVQERKHARRKQVSQLHS